MNGQLFELIIGGAMPPFIDLVNRYVKDSKWRYAVSILVCLIIGTILNLSKVSFENILGSGAIIFAAAQSTYQAYYSNSKLRTDLYGKKITKR